MMIPLLTEDQLRSASAEATGYIVDVRSGDPCIVHRAGCLRVDMGIFRSRVVIDRGRAGSFLLGRSLAAARAEAGDDAIFCPACLS